MSKLSVIAATVAILPAFALSSSALAAGMGQTEGGDIYRVKNVTKNVDFADSVNATCGETVQFKVRIHNPGPSRIDNVKVVATLPGGPATSFASTATVSAPNADPLSTSDTATANSDKTATLSYVSGSTQLLAAHNGTVVRTLPDTITSTGVTISEGVGVSVDEKRFVQFSAKLNCPPVVEEPIQVCELATNKIITILQSNFDASKHTRDLSKCKPTPGTLYVCEISTNKVVTIKENEFDSAKHTRDLSKCNVTPATPTELVKSGPTQVAAIFAVAAAFGALAYNVVLRRQNNG